MALSAHRATASSWRAFTLGLLTGLVYFAGTLYWVVDVMRTYGGLPTWIAVPVAGLLTSYLGFYVGGFALLVRFAIRRFGVTGVWLAPLFWVLTEWLRSTVGGGFPWALLGSSQALVVPVVQVASLVGVYGLSAFLALVGTAAAAVSISRRPVHRRAAVGVAVLFVVVTSAGLVRVRRGTLVQSGTPLRVGLVQGSIAQDDKYDPRFRDGIVRRYLDLTKQTLAAGAGLVIWPESSTPFIFDARTPLGEPLRRLAAESHTPILLGTDEFLPGTQGEPDRIFNSAMLVAADGVPRGTYRKMNLVPFGEYVPMKAMLTFVKPLVNLVKEVSDFSAGTDPVVFDAGSARVSVAICYESVYPSLSRTFVAHGSELLATITNDAWFGESSAAYQHFQQAALRGVEEGRYVVRAANTGISGAVDPYGRVLAETSLFIPAAVTVDVRVLSSRTIYSRTGDLVVWFSMAATAAALFFGWLEERTPRAS